MLRGKQILSKDRGKDRIEDDSRKGAKGAKFGEIEKHFLLSSLRSWRLGEKIFVEAFS